MTAAKPELAPDALLLIAPGCPHCPTVLEALSGLVKNGDIGRLEVVNIASHPERAAALGVRSVPWTRIGPFTLDGRHAAGELKHWAEQARRGGGHGEYAAHLLESSRLQDAEKLVHQHRHTLAELVALLDEPDTSMHVRIGIGALLEGMQDTRPLRDIVHDLGRLTLSELPQTRADACHYLGLTGSPEARPYAHACLEDADPEVRQIAMETLAILDNEPNADAD